MTTNTLSKTEFRAALSEAIAANRHAFPAGAAISTDVAWKSYRADPARFERVTEDNPSGHVGAAFVLAEGPWWIDPVRLAATSAATARLDLEEAIRAAVEDGRSLRDVAIAAGISHEQVRRIVG